jgi:hypothetical protein
VATPQFAFRARPETVTAIAELQALLADKRGQDVSKAEAIHYAVARAVEDLKAGDVVERMSVEELQGALRAKQEAQRREEQRRMMDAMRATSQAMAPSRG